MKNPKFDQAWGPGIAKYGPKRRTTAPQQKENLNFAEVFSLPISIFPIYEGPSGYVFLDEKDLWYNLWKNFLETNNSLLKFKLSSGNLSLKKTNLEKISYTNLQRKVILIILSIVLNKNMNQWSDICGYF